MMMNNDTQQLLYYFTGIRPLDCCLFFFLFRHFSLPSFYHGKFPRGKDLVDIQDHDETLVVFSHPFDEFRVRPTISAYQGHSISAAYQGQVYIL
jgi:hypothetical protein